jgi:large subunit ribosomal protein L24
MTQRRFKIKRGDLVEVMTGKAKGQCGVVERVLLDESKVVVAGVCTVERHIKPNPSCPDGHFLRTLPIHISNVAVVDKTTGVSGRVGYRINAKGEKERFIKKNGVVVERLR